MGPARYQPAQPGVAMESGKRDSNPRPQPWQGCALATELFPRAVGQSNRSVGFFVPPPPPPPPLNAPVPPLPPVQWRRGGSNPCARECHSLALPRELRPRYIGPRKTRCGGNTASYLDVVAVSSVFAPVRELFGLCLVTQGDPGLDRYAQAHPTEEDHLPRPGEAPRGRPRCRGRRPGEARPRQEARAASGSALRPRHP